MRALLPALLLVACSSGQAHRPAMAHADGEHVAAADIPAPDEMPSATSSPAPSGPFYAPDPQGRPIPILRADARNMRYAQLGRDACEAELTRRGAPFARASDTLGVLAPVRLRGPLRGVNIHSALPAAQRERSTTEIFDCRLVLALDDFCEMIAPRGVVEMIHLSAYRPQSAGGCTPKYVGKQHCAALALDVASFRRADGSTLEVERDFHGRIGLPTCGGFARPTPASRPAQDLWSFVCDAADRATFNVILTPNYNLQHKNHFHLEITPDAAWMLIH